MANKKIEGEKRTARLSLALTPTRLTELKKLAGLLGKTTNDLLNETIEDLIAANKSSEPLAEQLKNIQGKAQEKYQSSLRVKNQQ